MTIDLTTTVVYLIGVLVGVACHKHWSSHK